MPSDADLADAERDHAGERPEAHRGDEDDRPDQRGDRADHVQDHPRRPGRRPGAGEVLRAASSANGNDEDHASSVPEERHLDASPGSGRHISQPVGVVRRPEAADEAEDVRPEALELLGADLDADDRPDDQRQEDQPDQRSSAGAGARSAGGAPARSAAESAAPVGGAVRRGHGSRSAASIASRSASVGGRSVAVAVGVRRRGRRPAKAAALPW